MQLARDGEKLLPAQKGRGVVYMSEVTNRSVEDGLHVLRFEGGQVRRVGTDEKLRMDVEELQRMIKQDKQKGLVPFLIVAGAGSARTGCVDDLEAVAAVEC